jgi:hypothetical protein
MPKKTEAGVRTARRVRMVAKAVAGRSKAAIARDEGLSRQWIARELASPESRQIITAAVNHYLPRIARMFASALGVLEKALQANSIVIFKGEPVTLGPDHYARMVAVKRLTELMAAGRPPAKAPSEAAQDQGLTLEQLEALVNGKAKKPAVQ